MAETDSMKQCETEGKNTEHGSQMQGKILCNPVNPRLGSALRFSKHTHVHTYRKLLKEPLNPQKLFSFSMKYILFVQCTQCPDSHMGDQNVFHLFKSLSPPQSGPTVRLSIAMSSSTQHMCCSLFFLMRSR